MCGILGCIGKFTSPNLKILNHRGPDSSGYYSFNNLYLGHTRLSIQDLSSNGNQPMFSDDKNYIIIFNGEIYNHFDIRNSLINKYKFRSTSDTETVLYAFIEYGIDCLKMFNGIFAFAIYDCINEEIFIARDQLGVKPLYIYKDETKLLFSSEIKSFLQFNINKDIDLNGILNYMSFLWSPGETTPFKNVKKLLPGHFLKFKISNFLSSKAIRYYKIDYNGQYSNLKELDLINMLEEKLTKAVERQLLSDVPIGFFLSGGLDSSLLLAIAKKINPNTNYDCFTIDNGTDNLSNEGFSNDLYFAKKVADLYNVKLHIVNSEVDILKDFDKMIWHLDEPQADVAPLNVFKIAQLAKDNGIKVLIGGTAGDDLFSGYRRHQALNLEKYFNIIPRPILKYCNKVSKYLPSNISLTRRLRKLLDNINLKAEDRMASYFSWLPEKVMKELFKNPKIKEISDFSQTNYFKKLSLEIPNEKNNLNKMLYWELNTFLVDHNLNYTDKMAMATGVEARVPYLDIDLVNFSTIIPPHLKLKGYTTKYILKKVAERYLPMDLIYRPKTGFGAPLRKWITKDLDTLINERLSFDKLKKRGLFDPEKVSNLIQNNKNGKIDASYTILSLLAIESWFIQFVDL
jgi:asparagine synthase (glutamine-hydrolysing)